MTYKARVFHPDVIHSRSHKSNSTVVAIFSLLHFEVLKCVALNIKCNYCSMKVNFRRFQSSLSHTSEGGVSPSLSLKLLAGHLYFGFFSHLSIKNRYNKPCKLPDLVKIAQDIHNFSRLSCSVCMCEPYY